ncbi:hypothetical protein CRUP_015924 [Coryphaenoides rupestris]|nr:hypothetical protein CRUP_015924 [Coryphaenoides rupestris]
MASITQCSIADIPDNHKESWLALLSAAEAYCQKTGCDLSILTACKRFHPVAVVTAAEGDGPRKCDFSYNVWGQGVLAQAARRYMEDIAVLHSTTMLTAQRHARLPAGEAPRLGAAGAVTPSERTADGGTTRGSYPSIYSTGGPAVTVGVVGQTTAAATAGLNANVGALERSAREEEAERGSRQSSGIVDLEEECEE